MPKGRVHFSKEDIGGEILPILTKGLYRDTLDALREYIQNSIDGESEHIELVIDPDVVSIADDGVGMTAEESRKAIRLGISDKSPLVNVGFRGIGVYSAFNLCDSLELFTKSAREAATTYRIYFDFQRIRRELLAEQERRTHGNPPQLYLEKLLEDSVFVEPTPEAPIDSHGTKTIMSGILPESYRRLNNWGEVVGYLQNVVPLPFSPQFAFGPVIEQRFAQEAYRVVPLTLQIGSRRESVYRPYTNALFKFGGLHPPKFFDLKDSRQSFGFAWVCVNDARETIKDPNVRGLLIKKRHFSIGDRRYLESYFGRTVYSRRITGELIIQHDNLIPNAARSDFESNSTRQAFLEILPKFTRTVDKWANDIQEQELAREVLVELAARLAEINHELPAIQRDRERLLKLNAELAFIDQRLKHHAKTLGQIEDKSLSRTQRLLQGAETSVREALLAQRKARRKVEEEVVKAVQREALAPTKRELAAAQSAPTDLVSLFDAFGLADSPDLRRALQFIDENILRAHLDDTSYRNALADLRDHIEESL